MSTRKTARKTVVEAKPQYVVQNCSVVNTSAANEHTRAAVEALALAAKANADAIKSIADALKGAPATMDGGFKFGV